MSHDRDSSIHNLSDMLGTIFAPLELHRVHVSLLRILQYRGARGSSEHDRASADVPECAVCVNSGTMTYLNQKQANCGFSISVALVSSGQLKVVGRESAACEVNVNAVLDRSSKEHADQATSTAHNTLNIHPSAIDDCRMSHLYKPDGGPKCLFGRNLVTSKRHVSYNQRGARTSAHRLQSTRRKYTTRHMRPVANRRHSPCAQTRGRPRTHPSAGRTWRRRT